MGSFGGGPFAGKNASRTLIVATVAVAVCLMTLCATGTVAFLVALVLLAWGLFAMGMVPSLQYRR